VALGNKHFTLLGKSQSKTLAKFCRVITIPVLFDRFEYWTLTKEHTRTMEVAEMLFLREVTGYRMTNDKCEEVIREELGITDISTVINLS